MINITEISDKKNNSNVLIKYNTNDGIKKELREFKKLVDVKYDVSTPNYTCLYGNWGSWNNRFDYYLNTVLQLEDDFISELVFPKLVFYDIETDRGADDLKNSEVNSIAWIDDNEEYCLIKGVDGSEKEIIKGFIDYCKKNNIMGLVGHNSYWFDNKIMIKRCKHHKINYNLFYKHCNLDTMILASFLQFINNKYTGLNDLADLLSVEENKTDTGIYNPVTLYNEAIKEYENGNEEKIKLFREYNMQDVRLCKACFEEMNVKSQLTELFKQSRCPFNKIQYNTVLLNHYTCKYLHSQNIKVSESVNTEIKFKNEGGYNYYHESDELQVYNNVLVADIVSFYPHLLMLINADPYNQYENINRQTGEIKPFKKSNKVGLICELSKGLYESRAKTKKEMEQTEDQELSKQLNYEQKTKKIILNSLYGLLNQNNGNYILKNDLIAATITKMGRDILQHIVKKFGAVYAKTDSVFIPLKKDDKPEFILNALNIEVSKFIKDKYNLNNRTSNGQLIRFEEDSITDKLVLKDKNNYVKIDNNEYKFKGSDFNSSTLSDFEKDNIKGILDNINLLEAGESDKLKEILIENTKTTLKDVSDVKYFSKSKKLSEDQKNQRIIKDGIKYMENEDLPYSYGFPYLYCGVEDDKYNYIMFPKGYNPDLKINPVFVYDLLLNQMKKLKIINNKTKKELDKKYNIKSLNNKNKQIKDKYITNKDIVDLNNYNESVKIDKEGDSSYSKLYRKIGDKIKELTIMQLKWNSKKPTKSNIAWQKLTETNIKALKDYKGNIGIVFNPESQYKYGFIDIDGFKEDLSEKDNRAFKKDLYNLLKSDKDLYEHSVVQKTQSGGYHFIFKHNETNIINNKYMNSFKVPTQLKEDYNLKKYDKLGKKGQSGAIEIFINQKKYCVVYPSEIKPNKHYEIIHVGKEFGKPLKNIKEQLKKVFGDNKETTKEYKGTNKVKKENNIKINDKLKKEFLEDRELFNLLCEEFKNQTGKHNKILGTYTNILKYIGLSDGEAVNYMDRLLNIADPADYDEHIKQVESYLDTNDGTKPNVKEYLNNKELIEKLNTYLNPITNLTESNNNKLNELNVNNEIIELKDSRNETELYNTKEGSFAEYRGKILYSISPEFLYCMSLELNELHKRCSNYKEKIQDKELGLIEMVTGGFYHYGLLDDDIRKILNATSIPEFKEYAKLDNLIIKFGYGNIVYGFKHLFNNCVKICGLASNGENKQNQQVNEIYHTIRSLLYKATILNPFFYATKDMHYKQKKLQLLTNSNKVLLNCAFLEIEKCEEISVNKDSDNPLKFNFKIILKNGGIKELEGYTIKELEKYLQNKALFMKQNNTTNNNFIRHFINDSLNKGDIKTIKQPYIDGFLIELNKKGEYDIYTNIETDTDKYCTIEESIEELNEIYTDIYNSDDKFIRVLYWYLIHSLRPIWIELNIGNAVLNNLMLTGRQGTGKSLCVSIMLQMFSKSIITGEIGGEADTLASVKRALKNSTLPLILDDPTFEIKDLGGLLKKTTYGTQAGGKAGDQYGDDIKKHEVARQIIITTNDPAIIREGTNRRVWLLDYTEANIFNEEQLKALAQHSLNYKGECKLFRLNTITYEFSNFIKGFFKEITKNEVLELAKTKGVYLINEFLNYINSKSNIKLHNDFFDKDLYRFEVSTIDYTQLFYKNFLYALTRGEIINTSKYDNKDLKMMLSNGHTIIQDGTHMKRRKEYGIEYIIVKWNGLEEFIKSPAGLKQPYKKEEVYKLLDLPDSDNYKFKRYKIENKKVMGLKLSIKDFYKFFLDINIQETRKVKSLL